MLHPTRAKYHFAFFEKVFKSNDTVKKRHCPHASCSVAYLVCQARLGKTILLLWQKVNKVSMAELFWADIKLHLPTF